MEIIRKYNYEDWDSVVNHAKKLEGNSLRRLYPNEPELKTSNKGQFGQQLERIHFEYAPNTSSKPDFTEIELELKSTPLKKLKNGELSCKERLVLNLINYFEIIHEDFDRSSFWNKNKNLLIIFYIWEKSGLPVDYIIDLVNTWELENANQRDFEQIKRDWKSIKKKVLDGYAHKISGKDTWYLEACTKGKDKITSLTAQPHSNSKAPRRAFALKRKYLNTVYNKLKGSEDYQSFITNEEIKNSSIEEIALNRLSQYFNLSDFEIEQKLKITPNRNSKQYYSIITKKILGVSIHKSIEEFEKAGVVIKSIRIEEDNKIREHISFPTFKFDEIISENWNDSETKRIVESKFLFVFYLGIKDKRVLKSAKFWNLSNSDLDEFEKVYIKTQEIIKTGKIVLHSTPNRRFTNFPKSKDSYLTHVRPHAKNRNETYPLPVQDKKTKLKNFTKHCFWLNKGYIVKKVLKIDNNS